jgi:hypothetical protein
MMRIHDVPFVLFCETFYFITPVDIATIATFTGLLELELEPKEEKRRKRSKVKRGGKKTLKKAQN